MASRAGTFLGLAAAGMELVSAIRQQTREGPAPNPRAGPDRENADRENDDRENADRENDARENHRRRENDGKREVPEDAR